MRRVRRRLGQNRVGGRAENAAVSPSCASRPAAPAAAATGTAPPAAHAGSEELLALKAALSAVPPRARELQAPVRLRCARR